MSSINFDNPWLLLIAAPLLLLLCLPFFLTVRKDNRNFHNVTSCILHVLIAFLVAFSAAGTSVESVVTETNVYVVADVSYSANKNLEKIDGYINRLQKNLPLNTKMGVVCFGATDSYVVHTPLGEKPKSVRGALTSVNDSATDIASALEYTGKIFKGGVVKRIVLITDAKQTDESDKNALKRVVDNLYASKVYVDAIYLDNNLKEGVAEVQISNVEYAGRVYKGQEATANVYLQSSVPTRTTLKLVCGEEVLYDEAVELGVGSLALPIPLRTEQEGEFTYSVTLEGTEKDGNTYNNTQTFTQFVEGQPKTLFIVENRAAERQAEALYGENLTDAVDIRSVTDATMPISVAALCQYDEIVLSDVNVQDMGSRHELFIESLETVVSDLGKSLIGLGDLGLQNATGKMKTLADMLPVTYGNPVTQDRFFAILLDTSNSMFQASKFEMAKDAAMQLVDLLKPTDKVAVIGFNGQWSWIQTPTFADQPDVIKGKISAAEDDHGTVISQGLKVVEKNLLDEANGKQAQVFLLTDGGGIDEYTEFWACNDTVSNLYNAGMTTSVLAIGMEESSVSAVNGNLKKLANTGKGGYWAIANGADLDDGVFKEEVGGSGDAVTNRASTVEKRELFDDTLQGIDEVPFIWGYVPGRTTSDATTVLETTYYASATLGGASFAVKVPLYAYKDYGNGKTSSFTSFVTGTNADNALKNWKATGLDKQFLANVFACNVPTERVDVPFTSSLQKYLGGAAMEIRPCTPKVDATLSVALLSPNGERKELTNVVFDGGKYTCSFAMPDVGEYKTEITYTYKGESYTTVKSVSLSYLSEYDSFATFYASPLYQMLGSKGTVSENGELAIVNDESEIGMQLVDLTVPLLIAAVALFAVDIIVRKLKWADIKGLFKKIGRGNKA